MIRDWVIVVHAIGYYTNKMKEDMNIDKNFEDVIIFTNSSKREVIKYASEIFSETKIFYDVILYSQAKEEFEKRTIVTIDGIQYRKGQFIKVEEALRLALKGQIVGYCYNPKSCEKSCNILKNINKNYAIPIDAILNAKWRLFFIK